jgi:phosphopantothenoylcysteine decarboxylase
MRAPKTSLLRALDASTPTWLFPAMNTHMYAHPLTARHLSFVQEVLGYQVEGPIGKGLACGDVGESLAQPIENLSS